MKNLRKKITVVGLSMLTLLCLACTKDVGFDYYKFYGLVGRIERVETVYYANTQVNDSSITEKEIMIFNEEGQLKRKENFTLDKNKQSLIGVTLYKYNKDGLFEMEEKYDSIDQLMTKYKIVKSNAIGFPLEEILVEANSETTSGTKMVTSYHKNKRIAQFFDRDFLGCKLVSLYNDSLKVAVEDLIYYDDDKDSIVYEKSFKYLAFDKFGNWITRVATTSGEGTYSPYVEKRKINYY